MPAILPYELPNGSELLDLNLSGHLDAGDFWWGANSNWRVIAATGLFTMALRTSDIANNGANGSSWGSDWVDVKAVTMTLRSSPQETGLSYMQTVNQARSALTRSSGTSVRTVWWDGLGLMMNARVRASDPQLQTGQTHVDVVLQFTAADGMLYGATQKSVTLGVAGMAYGFDIPMPMPFNINTNIQNGQGICENDGTESAFPTITLYGPAPNPRIINESTGQYIKVPLTLNAGQYVTIDTLNCLIMLNGTSQIVEDPATSWWSLAPNSQTVVQYDSDAFNASASATIAWRDTYAT